MSVYSTICRFIFSQPAGARWASSFQDDGCNTNSPAILFPKECRPAQNTKGSRIEGPCDDRVTLILRIRVDAGQ